MTNEHDVEMARMGVALSILKDFDTGELREAANDYLKRQFTELPAPEPEKQETFTAILGGPHCTNIKPGRGGSLLYRDALHCFLKQGHDGPCDFRSMPGEPRPTA